MSIKCEDCIDEHVIVIFMCSNTTSCAGPHHLCYKCLCRCVERANYVGANYLDNIPQFVKDMVMVHAM